MGVSYDFINIPSVRTLKLEAAVIGGSQGRSAPICH